jgi:predicted transcriptional regulator
MTTLKVGIASYDEMKARTMAVARGERRVAANEPKVWFTSTESFAKVLSAGNRELLRVIAEKAPGSLDHLARITGKAKSNLSRTLRAMEGYGLVRLERGERGRITPKVMHDRVELDLQLSLADVPPSAMTGMAEARGEDYAAGYAAAMQELGEFAARPAAAVPTKPTHRQASGRGTNARLIAEVLKATPGAARPAEIRKALQSDKDLWLSLPAIRAALGELADRNEVTSEDGKIWHYVGKRIKRAGRKTALAQLDEPGWERLFDALQGALPPGARLVSVRPLRRRKRRELAAADDDGVMEMVAQIVPSRSSLRAR